MLVKEEFEIFLFHFRVLKGTFSVHNVMVLYIRDHEGLICSGQKITLNQPCNAFMAPWKYWLGTTKLKSTFGTT